MKFTLTELKSSTKYKNKHNTSVSDQIVGTYSLTTQINSLTPLKLTNFCKTTYTSTFIHICSHISMDTNPEAHKNPVQLQEDM